MTNSFMTAAEAKEALKAVRSQADMKAFEERLKNGEFHAELVTKRSGNHVFSFSNGFNPEKAHYLIDNGRTGLTRWVNLHRVLVVRMWVREGQQLKVQEA